VKLVSTPTRQVRNLFTHLNLGVPNKLEHVTRILDCVLTLLLGKNPAPKLLCLSVLRLLTLMVVVALTTHNVITDDIRCLSNIWSKLVRKTVRRILLVASMVGINAHLTVEVEGSELLRHERTIYRYLVKIYANAVILCITVEEHAELEKWVG
jgi:hypothetical protein